VLLPLDAEAFLRDRSAETAPAAQRIDPSRDPDAAYYFGFGRPSFFDAGPAGFDATFRFTPAAVPELADIRFSPPTEVAISGSLLIYELDPAPDLGLPVPALDAEFPGIRRTYLEERVRYSFARYGVTYVVSAECFDASFSRYRLITCRDADRAIALFLHKLHLAGGAPEQTTQALAPPTPQRPADALPTFTYHGPGHLIPGTGYRGNGGRADYTVYSNIRFPLAEAPAFANTQYYRNRVAGSLRAYPWRDNFCESRSYAVTQCPGGWGHQGQDVAQADCNAASLGADGCTPQHNDVVAVSDGIIMRAPGQEAVYLFINTANEHVRFRYLHMRPKLLDADHVVSGRRVKAGELLGQVGNYSQHENGTSFHLHFDAQVPTRAGWVFVNPYMTLVASYERKVGGRGTEVPDMVASATITLNDAAGGGAFTLAAIRHAILATEERAVPAVDDVPRPHWRRAAVHYPVARCGYRYWRGCAMRPTFAARGFRGVRGWHHYAPPRAATWHRYRRGRHS
jgi:peptidase M23-like protein